MYAWTFLVFLGMAGLPFHSVQGYSYTCYPNNTIAVSGLPTNYSSMNYFAIQEADGKNCSVTGVEAAGTAEITECDKDQPILFTFSSYSGMLTNQIHGGQEVEIVNLTCIEISDSGVASSVDDTLAVSIDIDDVASMNVTYDITSDLNPTSANVGDPVIWTIYFPMNYTLEITTCTAYPGTDSSSSNSILLITDWCSDVGQLISNFSTNAENTEASATIQAFKFFDEDNVYLTCTLLVCPPSSSSCDSVCGSARKRRRRSSNGEYTKSIGKVLHIIDTTSAAYMPRTGFFMTLVMIYLASLL
ncbi:uncharacterized protein LOC123551348 [Mercenaria mercenaria]|uniref:uncharacterized protein LOC123551348 n=1 Tax=Mercenaria mercenaria TaxID=6596 RepID=UPI00234EB06F|nr:uncharacterized protein LOC123551348 [Mercenaria mercenaria]